MNTSLTTEQLQAMLDASPAIMFLGLRVLSADAAAQEVVMYAPMRPEFERGAGSGQWHGGPMAAIVDTVGDFALVMLLGRGLPTINFRIDYFRPAIGTGLRAVGRVRRAGRSVGTADVELLDDKGALVALGRCTYATSAP